MSYYRLEPGGTQYLEVRTEGFFHTRYLFLVDGDVVLETRARDLDRGAYGRLPDGSALEVHIVRGDGAGRLSISRNGVPLPGSAGGRWGLVRDCAKSIQLMAMASVFLESFFGGGNLSSVLSTPQTLWPLVAYGLLAAAMMVSGLPIILLLASGLFVVEGLASLNRMASFGTALPALALVVAARLFLLQAALGGWRRLRAAPRSPPPPPEVAEPAPGRPLPELDEPVRPR